MIRLHRFELPLPPKVLHPNRPSHFRVVAKAKKEYSAHCRMLVRSTKPAWDVVKDGILLAEFVTKSGQRQDRDNLRAWMKYAIDSLERERVVEDDKYLFVKSPTLRKGTPALIITLCPIDDYANNLIDSLFSLVAETSTDQREQQWLKTILDFRN
jgi:hypothetical protein